MRIRYFLADARKHWGPQDEEPMRLPPRMMQAGDHEWHEEQMDKDNLHRSFGFEAHTISNPPRTWASYLADGEYWGIVNMEFYEAERCMQAYKSGSQPIDKIIEELGHLASAAVQARVYLMDKKDKA